jgi:hypothetical protein
VRALSCCVSSSCTYILWCCSCPSGPLDTCI